MKSAVLPRARPIRRFTPGAPYQPGVEVVVVVSAESKGSLTDVSDYIGRKGKVEHLEYSCGCGQHYPDDPMIGVRFFEGDLYEFWWEELGLP